MLRSWAVFDPPLRNGLLALKYSANLGLGEAIAGHMLGFVSSLGWPIELMLPVPLGKRRLKERGYNQVGLVARPLAYQLGWRYRPDVLWKTRDTPSQVGLNFSQRRDNVRNAYRADPQAVKEKSVLVMDDVATTGSTILACTEALRAAGARKVYVLTIARALLQHGLDRV